MKRNYSTVSIVCSVKFDAVIQWTTKESWAMLKQTVDRL